MRDDKRENNQMRPVTVQRRYTKYAPGSVLISYGETRVLCTVSIEDRVPPFLRDQGKGWLTAEYSMLPGATHTRSSREVQRGKPSGRTNEIQRLIGRALRAAIDFEKMGERTFMIDCDVLQADGGTRTASITGSMLALQDAVQSLMDSGEITESPIKERIAAVSVGKVDGELLCDLCYTEDSSAEMDMNVVMTEGGNIIEIQATAEQDPIPRSEIIGLMDIASEGISQIFESVSTQTQAA